VPRLPRRLVPRFAAAGFAALGLALVGVGALQATVFAPQETVRSSLRDLSRQPAVTTAIGVLEMGGPRVKVTAESADPAATVFLGIGRAADVEAYLGQSERLDVVGYTDEGELLTQSRGAGALPAPSTADVWTVSVRGRGSASLVWPRTAGQWRLVASAGTTGQAPSAVTVTWSGREHTSSAPTFIALGVLLIVGGGVTLAMLWSRGRPGAHVYVEEYEDEGVRV